MAYYVFNTPEGKVFRLSIRQSENSDSPLDWDSSYRMLCWHSRYDLGHEKDWNEREMPNFCESWEAIEKYVKKEYNALAILPIYMYDHSGIAIKTTPFGCRWDSGRLGLIYVSSKTLQSGGWTTQMRRKHLKENEGSYESLLRSYVSQYNTYVSGDVWRGSIEQLVQKTKAITVPSIFGGTVAVTVNSEPVEYDYVWVDRDSLGGMYGSEGIESWFEEMDLGIKFKDLSECEKNEYEDTEAIVAHYYSLEEEVESNT